MLLVLSRWHSVEISFIWGYFGLLCIEWVFIRPRHFFGRATSFYSRIVIKDCMYTFCPSSPSSIANVDEVSSNANVLMFMKVVMSWPLLFINIVVPLRIFFGKQTRSPFICVTRGSGFVIWIVHGRFADDSICLLEYLFYLVTDWVSDGWRELSLNKWQFVRSTLCFKCHANRHYGHKMGISETAFTAMLGMSHGIGCRILAYVNWLLKG